MKSKTFDEIIHENQLLFPSYQKLALIKNPTIDQTLQKAIAINKIQSNINILRVLETAINEVGESRIIKFRKQNKQNAKKV